MPLKLPQSAIFEYLLQETTVYLVQNPESYDRFKTASMQLGYFRSKIKICQKLMKLVTWR